MKHYASWLSQCVSVNILSNAKFAFDRKPNVYLVFTHATSGRINLAKRKKTIARKFSRYFRGMLWSTTKTAISLSRFPDVTGKHSSAKQIIFARKAIFSYQKPKLKYALNGSWTSHSVYLQLEKGSKSSPQTCNLWADSNEVNWSQENQQVYLCLPPS